MFSIVVNPQDISMMQDKRSTNPTPATEEDATRGMKQICKKLLNNKLTWKMCICIYAKNGR